MAFEVVFLPDSCVAYCNWDISICTVCAGACFFTQHRLGDCYFCYLCEIQQMVLKINAYVLVGLQADLMGKPHRKICGLTV